MKSQTTPPPILAAQNKTKEYHKPEFEVIDLNIQSPLLAGCGTPTSKKLPTVTYKVSDAAHAGKCVPNGDAEIDGYAYATTPHIFLPAAGYRRDQRLNRGSKGYYWSSSLFTDDPYIAYCLYFYSDDVNPQGDYLRRYGQSVRAVRRSF